MTARVRRSPSASMESSSSTCGEARRTTAPNRKRPRGLSCSQAGRPSPHRQGCDSSTPGSWARALARVCGVVACGADHDGVRLLQAATLRGAIAVQRAASDVLTGDCSPLAGVSPVWRGGVSRAPESGDRASGLGGLLALADPESRVSFASVPRALELDLDRENEGPRSSSSPSTT